MRVYLGEGDESLGVEDVDVTTLRSNHQTADPVLVGRALLQSPNAGDDRLDRQEDGAEQVRGERQAADTASYNIMICQDSSATAFLFLKI